MAALEHFVLVLALCHTVIPEVDNNEIVYRASSPDEEALVKAAKEVGVVFKARSRSHIVIEVVSFKYVELLHLRTYLILKFSLLLSVCGQLFCLPLQWMGSPYIQAPFSYRLIKIIKMYKVISCVGSSECSHKLFLR